MLILVMQHLECQGRCEMPRLFICLAEEGSKAGQCGRLPPKVCCSTGDLLKWKACNDSVKALILTGVI